MLGIENLMCSQGPLIANPRVALVSGFWAQNIGNAFFNIGGKWLLEQTFGAEQVGYIQDQPGYRTFHDQSKGNPIGDIGYLKFLDIDYVVLQGPLLTKNFGALWSDTFASFQDRGVKVLLLGAAFFKYDDKERDAAFAVLDAFPPAAVVTRDSLTYSALISRGFSFPIYDGIDSAFATPRVCVPFKTMLKPFVVFNFDRYLEPTITINNPCGPNDRMIEVGENTWTLSTPKILSGLTYKSKIQAYLAHLLDQRKLPAEIQGMRIVRPEHRSNPHMTYKIYQHPNAIVSDEPFTYLNVYANAELTLSDRVHACIATLAYGNPAMLFTPSPRSALFDRLGLSDVKQRLVALEADRLAEEIESELRFLSSALT